MNLKTSELAGYLKDQYQAHTIILYGSIARGDYTNESDIDVIAFVQGLDEEICDNREWDGRILDAWIKNDELMKYPDSFIHLRDGIILSDDFKKAPDFLEKIKAIFSRGPEIKNKNYKEHVKAWCRKTLIRSSRGDVEGKFRLNWLLMDLLQYYFVLRDKWYLGPKESIRELKEIDSVTYNLYARSLDRDLSFEELESLVIRVIDENR